ncbi:hypothetical protein TNCV_178941 [Trichonephila clavipes]|nr:hypothetical protein TNCV_178941 [Trichonephila clavipes]
MVLKANDRRTSCPCRDEFRGPRSDYVRQRIFSRDTRIQTDDATPRRSRVRNHELLPTVTSYIFSNRIP